MHIQSLDGEDPLEEDMTTLSSIVAWRIPMDRGAWQVIQSIGSPRVGRNLRDLACMHAERK